MIDAWFCANQAQVLPSHTPWYDPLSAPGMPSLSNNANSAVLENDQNRLRPCRPDRDANVRIRPLVDLEHVVSDASAFDQAAIPDANNLV
jgi:hypothetical protein